MRSAVRRTARWVGRVAVATVVLAAVGYVALQVGARIAIRKAVASVNIPGLTYHVAEVSLSRVRLTDVRWPEGAVGATSADFSLWELLQGKVRSVDVAGVEVVVDITDSGMRVRGLPRQWFEPSRTGGAAGPDLSALPARVRLSAGVIELVRGDRRWVAAVSADLTAGTDPASPGGAKGRQVLARAALGTDRVEIKAFVADTLSARGEARGEARGTLSLATLCDLANPSAQPLHADGTLAFVLAGDTSLGTLSAQLQTARSAIRFDTTAAADDVSLDLTAAWRQSDDRLLIQGGMSGVASLPESAATLLRDPHPKFTLSLDGAVDGAINGASGRAPSGSVTASAALLGDGLAVTLQNLKASFGPAGTSGGGNFAISFIPGPGLEQALARAGVLTTGTPALVAKGTLTALQNGDRASLTAAIDEASADLQSLRLVTTDGQVLRADTIRAQMPDTELTYLHGPAGDSLIASSRGARGSIDTLSAEGKPYRTGRIAWQTDALSARWSRGPHHTAVTETSDATTWDAGTPAIHVVADPVDVPVGPTILLRGLSASVHLGASVTPEAAVLRLLPGSAVRVAEVTSTAGTSPAVSVGPLRLDLTPRQPPTTRAVATTSPGPAHEVLRVTTLPASPDAHPTPPPRPLLTLPLTGDVPPVLAVTATLAQDDPTTRPSAPGIEIKSGTATARIGSVTTSIDLTLGDRLGLDGFLHLANADLTYPDADLAVRGFDLRLPLSLDAAVPLEGVFSSRAVERLGQTLPGFTGKAYVTRTQAWAGAEWPVISEGVVKASADIRFRGDKSYADLQAWVPSFGFTRTGELLKILPPGISSLDATGTFSAEVRYFIDGENIYRWGEINVSDATLRSKDLDAELTGINGRIWTRAFDPVETPPGQTLSVKSARLGKYNVQDGRIDFRLDPGNILFVESAAFRFCDGEVGGRGFRVGYTQNAADLVLYADRLDLAQLAPLVSDGKVTGSGRLYLRVPVSVKWPDRLTLGTGYVYAQGGDDYLSLGGNADEVARLITGAASRDPSQNLVQERLTQALVRFAYRQLSVELIRNDAGDLTARVRLAGRGDATSDNQVLDLTFNVTGIEDLVSAALLVRRASGGR